MIIMNNSEIKANLHDLVDQIEDKTVLKACFDLLKRFSMKSQEADFWLELSEDERKEIEQGIKDLKEGKSISFNSFINKHK